MKTETAELKPIHKDLQFASEAAFKRWLKKTTKYIITFIDNGQDLRKIWVADNGEIIHCNQQAWVWNGDFVDISKAKKGQSVLFYTYQKRWTEMGFIIENVTKLSVK